MHAARANPVPVRLIWSGQVWKITSGLQLCEAGTLVPVAVSLVRLCQAALGDALQSWGAQLHSPTAHLDPRLGSTQARQGAC